MSLPSAWELPEADEASPISKSSTGLHDIHVQMRKSPPLWGDAPEALGQRVSKDGPSSFLSFLCNLLLLGQAGVNPLSLNLGLGTCLTSGDG